MSGGTPTAGGGYMRQRFSQGYSSSGDDLEDDACSRTPAELSLPSVQRARTWSEVLENLVWVVSAVFIVYYGDRETNMISLLWSDERVRRTALHLGLATAVSNMVIVLCTIYYLSSFPPKSYEKSEAFSAAAPLLILLGLLSFCLFSYALWPIWSVLTIPLLLTLFMASMVMSTIFADWPIVASSVVLRDD